MINMSIALLLVGWTLWSWFHNGDASLKCVISSVDGERYCVRERQHLNKAADLLATTALSMSKVVEYCNQNYHDDDAVKRLVSRYDPIQIKETLPTSEFTAYSENKGQKMALCVNKKRDGTKLIDQNTLTFVALHELAHIMSVSIGHTKEFWQNFKFLLDRGVEIGVYAPVDYSKTPTQYCGMDLTSNPYYSDFEH
jgi:hypothetical protein